MDCADRIAVMTEDRILEPVRRMRELAALSAVTVRVLSAGRRCDVTIRQACPEEEAYGWEALEVGRDGVALPGGVRLQATAALADPEAAYWEALDTIAGASERKPSEAEAPAAPR